MSLTRAVKLTSRFAFFVLPLRIRIYPYFALPTGSRRELLPRIPNQRESNSPATQSSKIADVIKTLQRVLEEGIMRLSPEEIASISNVIQAASSASSDEMQMEKKDI